MSNSVIRVWALASCGGLLALTACSNDRSGTPQVDSPSPLEDDLAQIDAQPEPVASLPRPVVRPETLNSRPLFPRTDRPPSATTVAGRQSVSSSAEQLRARVQQIRAQRAKVLPASGTPTFSNRSPRPVTTLSPSAVGAQNPLPGSGRSASTTEARSGTELTRNVLPTSQQLVTALPTPAQPTLAPGVPATSAINPANPSTASQPAANPTPSSAAVTSPAPTALTRNAPITPSRHQSYSVRAGQGVALTPLASSGLAGNSPVELAGNTGSAPRIHQSTVSIAGAEQNTATPPAQPLFPIAETAENEADIATPAPTGTNTAATDMTATEQAPATPPEEAAANPGAAPTDGPVESGGHLSAGRPTLTAAPQAAPTLQAGVPRFSGRTPHQHISGLAPSPGSPSPGAPAPAIAPEPLAESLPLDLSPVPQRPLRVQVRPEATAPRLTAEPQPSGASGPALDQVPPPSGLFILEPSPSPSSVQEPGQNPANQPVPAEANRPEVQPMSSPAASPKALTLSYCSRPDLLTSLLTNPGARRLDAEAAGLKTKLKTFLNDATEEPTEEVPCLPGTKPNLDGQLHGQLHGQRHGSK